jgi:hypothetical protein
MSEEWRAQVPGRQALARELQEVETLGGEIVNSE